MDPYEIIPYTSLPIPESHPAHLAVLGALFGLDTADPRGCRVLELGCASGGNLIPLAARLPGSRFLGIELAASQVAAGGRLIAAAGLSNCELRCGDILTLAPEGLGEFDYIIAHGVYSWVPGPVREGLLALVGRLLAPQGVLYLSYNTLPGWRMRGMLRDILLHAARGESDPHLRLERAYAALDRLEPGLAGLDALSARYLREEIAALRRAPASYLLFEYLAEHNQPFLFREVLEATGRHGLGYLCDAELATQFPASYGDAVEQAVAGIEDDMEVEQWLDFIANRTFRRSLWCRADARVDDAISLERFAGLAFCSELRPPAKVDLRRAKPAPFRSGDDPPVQVSHPLTKALLAEIGRRYPDALSLDELLPIAHEAVTRAGGGPLAGEYDECLMELFSLFANRSILALPYPDRLPAASDPPRLSPLAAAELAAGLGHLSTHRHTTLELDDLATRLLQLLDGRQPPAGLIDLLCDELLDGRLQPPAGIRPRQEARDRLRGRVEPLVLGLLGEFRRQGMLA